MPVELADSVETETCSRLCGPYLQELALDTSDTRRSRVPHKQRQEQPCHAWLLALLGRSPLGREVIILLLS
jgi:hypothetical protein